MFYRCRVSCHSKIGQASQHSLAQSFKNYSDYTILEKYCIRRADSTSSPRSHAPAPLPPLHHRWRGGKAGKKDTGYLYKGQRQLRQTCLERDNQEYQALRRNLFMHLATGIITFINYTQKSKTNGKKQLATSNSRHLAALTPL